MARRGGLGRSRGIREPSYKSFKRAQLIIRGQHVWHTSEYNTLEVAHGSSAVLRLSQSLFPLFALALDLPEDFFDDKVSLLSLIP